MNWQNVALQPSLPADEHAGAAARILQVQTAEGAIPWYENGPWDPWNHMECVMALNVLGERDRGDAAIEFLAATQTADGSWWCDYGNAVPMRDRLTMSREPAPQARDSNFAAYCAVALVHHYACYRDLDALRRYWPMVRSAMAFVGSLQSPHGDIAWSAECHGDDATEDALIAGNASIYKSLDCALLIAEILDEEASWLQTMRTRLGAAFRDLPHRFNRQGENASAFAMDWYYPVLAGLHAGDDATERLNAGWSRFVEEGRGCRCVETEPWVTVAETCELVLTLLSCGKRHLGAQIFESQKRYRDPSGAYWMGWQFDERIFWPAEQPSWTQAAAILAGDAVYGLSPACNVLTLHDGEIRRNIRRL